MSYWWGQMVKKPDAKTSQEFFFLAGTNVTFTYTNNRVIINGSPGTNVATMATNAINAQFAGIATNWVGSNALWLLVSNGTNSWSTNAIYAGTATNWTGSNALWLLLQTNIYATNLIGLSAGTNIYFTTNGSGFLEINASNQTATALDIRTNAYNVFTGTNQFNTNVYVIGGLGVSGCSNMTDGYGTIAMAVKNQTANYNLLVSPVVYSWTHLMGNNAVQDGTLITSRATDRGSVAHALALSGGQLILSGDTINFFHNQSYLGGINTYGILIWGADPTISSVGYWGSTSGGIECTNFIFSYNYVWGYNGLLVSSNSWTKVPNYQVSGTSKSIADGENWYVSSNGWPYIISKRLGVVYTNDIPAITRGISTFPSAGVVTVTTSASSSIKVVTLAYQSTDGNNAYIWYDNVVAGVSFDIHSSNGSDVNKVAWAIIDPP